MTKELPVRLAIAGLGAIGLRVARAVDAGEVDGFQLVAVSASDHERATERVSDFRTPPKVLLLEELADVADVVIECAPADVFEQLARPVVEQGKCLIPLSVGALLNHPELIDDATRIGARINVRRVP